MDNPPPPAITYTAAGLATVVLILLSRRLFSRKLKLPPGPKPWPIIGNFNLIGPLPHRSLHELAKKYGPIMQIKFGSIPVVVGSSAEVAEAILKTHDISLADRPKIAAGKYTTYNYSDITWSQYGPYWSHLRKFCNMEIFSPKRLDFYQHVRVEELHSLLRSLYKTSGTPFKTREKFSDLSLSVISRLVLGRNYTLESEKGKGVYTPHEFKKILDELFVLNGVLEIGDWIPWLSYFDLQGNIKKMKAVAKKVDRFIEHELEEHDARRNGVKNYVAKDMMDILLQLSDDPSLDVEFGRTGVKALTLDLIAGGTESSAVTVEWAISEILRKPEVFEKATEELDRVIGRERWVEEKDMVNLPYIYAIAKEVMRLHPVAPMLVPRAAREDINVNGYDIKKGSRVLVNVWTIGRDPKVWDKPDEFCPERFIGNSIDVRGHDYELLPFGAGRRMCPGYPLGLKVIQATLSNLLHGFKWRLPDGVRKEELSMEEIFGLSTPKKYPLVAVAEPRLPAHVYPK
uniref:Cytochrome P450 71A1-like n=1 Tax=Populus alba TaxID=43335 RepID=A0A4U5P6C9_POPAL|nr:hypothetical protein D5086_0000218750 [Populus alba]